VSLPPLYDESDYEALREEKDARIAGLEAAYNDVVAVNENELALRLEAEAALAERDRMLGLCYDEEMEGSWTFDGWLADLKARAKEGSGDE